MMQAMKPLPLPVRVAAGLVAMALEQARDLPRTVLEFPVTAVSQALQVSMRVQQKVTELAIKGDRALGGLRPVEERPSWARFDDDESPHANGSTVTALRPERAARTAVDVAAEATRAAASPTDTGATDPSGIAPERSAADLATGTAAATTRAAAEHEAPAAPPAPNPADDRGPNVLPDYPQLSIPQLRAKLRVLSAEDLRTLLEWEHAHGDRPPFVTMLTNRLTTVSGG